MMDNGETVRGGEQGGRGQMGVNVILTAQGKTALRRYGERSFTVGESEMGPSARTFLLELKW
jgi:hypothetical protein